MDYHAPIAETEDIKRGVVRKTQTSWPYLPILLS
jgi:hypothetical protein